MDVLRCDARLSACHDVMPHVRKLNGIGAIVGLEQHDIRIIVLSFAWQSDTSFETSC